MSVRGIFVLDSFEDFRTINVVSALIDDSVEECLKSLEVLVGLIGFLLSDLHFFLELTEGSGVGALILLEELEDLLDAL